MASDYHHGDLRTALLDAAGELLADRGPDRLSIRAVARRVGVSPNAPYRHFTDREELLAELAADGYRWAARHLAGSSLEGSAAVAATWSTLSGDRPGLFQLMVTLPAGEGTALEGAILEWLGEVARRVDAEAGPAEPEDSIRRAVACWAAVHGLLALRLTGALGVIDDWMLPSSEAMARRAIGPGARSGGRG